MRIDPVIFRITLAVLAVFGGIGLLIYGAAWLLMPEDGTAESDGLRLLHGRTPTTMLAAILVGVAGLVVISNFAHDSRPGGLPILLVLVIVAVLIALFRGRRPGQANQAGTGIASWSRSRLLAIPLTILILFVGFGRQHHSFALLLVALVVLLVVSPIFSQNRIPSMSGTTATAPATTTEPLGPPAGYSPSRPSYGEQPWNMAPTSAPPTPRRRAPKPPRQPSFLFPLTVSVGVVVAGVLFALGASGRVDITAQDLFAATLLTVGVGLVVAAWLGRARSLLAVGVILSIGLIVTATVNVPLRGGIGVREIGADRTSELAPAYHLGLGEQNLNLQNLQLAGRTQHLSASLGIGHLFVQVPANMKVVVHAYAGTGKTELFDVFDGGTQINHTTVSTPPDPQAGELDLDLRVGVGEVEIVRVNQGDQP